jgi:hypothetical protein
MMDLLCGNLAIYGKKNVTLLLGDIILSAAFDSHLKLNSYIRFNILHLEIYFLKNFHFYDNF